MSPRLTVFLLLACVCGAFAQQLGQLTDSDSARIRAAVARVVQHQLRTTPTTCAVCESHCGACLVKSVSTSTSFKSIVIAPTDITKAFLLSWAGGVVEVADNLYIGAMAAHSNFSVNTLTISSGGAATTTVYMGATAKDVKTGNIMLGLSVGHSSGTTIQQHKRVAYECCHSCWIGLCCNTCHEMANKNDTVAQADAIINSLTRSALTAMLSAIPSTIRSRTNPLALSSYTISPDVVVYGDWQSIQPESAAGSLSTQHTVVEQGAIAACVSVWSNAALQQARRINSTNPQLTAAQSLLPTDGSPAPTTSFTVPSNDLYKSVITQVNPFHDPQQVLAVNDFGISCQPGDALIVSTQNAASGMAVFNSVMVICHKQRATVWTIGTFASPEQAVSGNTWTSSSVTVLSRGVATATIQNGTRGFAAKASMAVQELWLVQSVAKDLGVSLPEGLSGRAQGAVEVSAGSVGGWTSALKHFTSGVKSVVSAFKSIASMFGSHTTTTEIKEDTCEAFDNFVANTTVHTIQCMPDTIVREWAGYQFADLKWAFPNNDSYMAELLDWEYAHASNWTKNNIQLSNTKESTLSQLTVFANHDDEQQCSNWIITEYSGVFKLAPDLIYWRKTKTGFMGFDSSSSVYIQKVPARISLQDVEAIEEFMEMVIFSRLAADRGVPYTPPKLPTCKS